MLLVNTKAYYSNIDNTKFLELFYPISNVLENNTLKKSMFEKLVENL